MAEIFAHHEINRESLWPVLSKILVGSLAFHLLAGVVMNYVPVARAIFGTAGNALDVAVVDEDYERTIVQDDVTFLTLQGGRFQYPEGYFAMANGTAPAPDPNIIPLPAPPPQVVPLPTLPPPMPAPTVAKLPTPIPLPPLPKGTGVGAAGGTKKPTDLIAKNQPTPTPAPTPAATPTPGPQTKEDADKEMDKIAAEKKVVRPRKAQVNTRPFDDLWKRYNDAQAQQTLDWGSDAEVTLEGDRTPDGKLTNLRAPVPAQGNPALVQLLKELVAATGDSGAFYFLDGTTRYKFILRFKGADFTARIEGAADSPDKAKELAQAYSTMLLAARIYKKDEEEAVYLNNAKISAKDANVVITFSLNRNATKDLINKQLIAAANKTQPPPSPQAPQTP